MNQESRMFSSNLSFSSGESRSKWNSSLQSVPNIVYNINNVRNLQTGFGNTINDYCCHDDSYVSEEEEDEVSEEQEEELFGCNEELDDTKLRQLAETFKKKYHRFGECLQIDEAILDEIYTNYHKESMLEMAYAVLQVWIRQFENPSAGVATVADLAKTLRQSDNSDNFIKILYNLQRKNSILAIEASSNSVSALNATANLAILPGADDTK